MFNKTSSRHKYSHIQTTRASSCLEFLISVFQYYNWRQRLIQTQKGKILFKSWNTLTLISLQEGALHSIASRAVSWQACNAFACTLTGHHLQQVNVESFLGPGHFSPCDSPLMATPQELAIRSDQEHLCQTRPEVLLWVFLSSILSFESVTLEIWKFPLS